MTINGINLTPRAQNALISAGKIAKGINHSYVGAEHIFLGILGLENSVVHHCLNEMDVSIPELKNRIEREITPEVCEEKSQTTIELIAALEGIVAKLKEKSEQ